MDKAPVLVSDLCKILDEDIAGIEDFPGKSDAWTEAGLQEVQNGDIYRLGSQDRNQFVWDGQLDMEHLLEKFVEYFDDFYGDREQRFIEMETPLTCVRRQDGTAIRIASR